jgi:hypothetical protein
MNLSDSRRNFLQTLGLGLGAMSINGFVPGMGMINAAFAADLADPLSPKKPHFPAKVKSVIWLHQNGAPSSLDLFDYKPQLAKLTGTDVPPSFLQGIETSTQGGTGKLYVDPKRSWKQYGESGAWFSDLMPNLAKHADDLTFIKSSKTIGATHDIRRP